VSGLQQVAIANPPRKRTISNTDDIYDVPSEGTGSGSDGRGLPAVRSSSAMTASSSNSATASRSSAGSPAISPNERRSSVRPMMNRRTSSNLSGVSQNTSHTASMSTGGGGRETPTGRQRLVTRMSSAGALNSVSSPSPVTMSRTSSSAIANGEGRSMDSSGGEERRLRRSNNRLSLNAVLNRRPHFSDSLRRPHEDDVAEGGESSPSSSAKERRERRLAGQAW
jgi:hypothetical protein